MEDTKSQKRPLVNNGESGQNTGATVVGDVTQPERRSRTRPKLSAHARTREAALESFVKIIPAVFERQPRKDEIFLRPAELLEIARKVRAFGWILESEVASACDLSPSHQRSERKKFSWQCQQLEGQTLINDVRFDSIGQGHAKRYRFRREPGQTPVVRTMRMIKEAIMSNMIWHKTT
jgi:hypothetical protein